MNLAHLDNRPVTLIPPATRGDVVDLIKELEERYRRRWFSFNLLAEAVRDRITEPLRQALLCGHLEDLEHIYKMVNMVDMWDNCGTDYRCVKDLAARVQVLAMEGRHRLAHGGAPFPP